MSTLVDFQIRNLARTKGLVEPFDPEQVNPASYDVTLGTKILVEPEPRIHYSHEDGVSFSIPVSRWEEVDISETAPYILRPGEFVLAHTAEVVRVPNNLECVFNLKSSRGREGFDHLMAAYIDPGFTGRVTLELVNVNRYNDLKLSPGMRIGQLRFSRLDATPMRSYAVTGRYFGDSTVQPSKG